jgi:flagellin FlaB
MELNQPDDSDRGQVGIGTLIVFIAMVLVAAIAAGVLINTAGFLQSKSEETGQESSQQVTNRIQSVTATGDNITSNSLDTVKVTVKKAPGADNIDLENVTVQWVGPSGTFNLVESGVSAGGADGSFYVNAFKDGDGSSPVLNSPDDRFIVRFELTDSWATSLDEGESVTVRMTSKSGATVTETLVVPESLSGKTAVNL